MANVSSFLDSYVIEVTLADRASAGADQAAAALSKLEATATATAAAVRDAGQATSDAGAKVATAATSFDRLAARVDPVTRAYASLQRAQDQLRQAQEASNRELAAGGADVDQINRTIAAYVQRVNAAATALGEARSAAEATAAATAAWNGALGEGSAAAQAYSASVAATAQASRTAQNAAEEAAAAQKAAATSAAQFASQIDAARAKFIPGYAASQQYASGLNQITEAEKIGALTAGQAALARDKLTASFAAANAPTTVGTQAAVQHATALTKVTEASGAAAAATRNLSIQTIQAVSGLVTGQDVLTVLVQQGHQVADSALAMGTGFGGVATAAKGMLTAIGGLTTVLGVGAAAAFAALAVSAENAQDRMKSLQNELRATRADYEGLATAVEAAARASAATTGVSLSDARAAAQAIASSPSFTGDQQQLQALLKTSQDLAVVLGKSVPDAARELAEALKSPGAEAEKLATSGMPGFSAQLAYSISLMEKGGDRAGAYAKLMDGITTATAGARNNITPLQQAIQDLTKAFSDPESKVGGFFRVLGDAIISVATRAVEMITGLVNAIDWAAKAVGKYLPSVGRADTGAGYQALPNGMYGPTAPTVVGSDTSLPVGVSKDIYRIAEANMFGGSAQSSAVQADFATRLANIESQGRQFVNGQVYTSSAGAQGVMQLMPGTAAGLGVDPTTQEGNITGGLKYIAELWTKYGGDPNLVAMAYNWGPGNVDAFLAGTKQLPASVQGYAQKATGITPSNIAGDYAGSFSRSTSRTPDQAAAAQSSANQAFTAAIGQNGLSTRIEQNQALQSTLQTGLNEAVASNNVPAIVKLSEALKIAKGDANDLITEQQKLARSATDSIQPLSAEEGATRKVAEVRQQFVEAARHAGTEVDAVALAQAQAAALYSLAHAYNDNIAATDRQTAANQRIGGSLDGTAASYLAATNREKALVAAREAFLPGQDQAAAVDRYTAALNRQAASAADLATVQKSFDQRDQLELIQAEAAGIGQNVDVTTKQLALLREKQDLIKRGADLQSAASQADLANVAAIADATAALQHQKEAMSELSSFTDHTFSTISDAITASFAVGEHQAVKFGDVAKSVVNAIEAEFLKLALLNPLKNALFGSNSTTLSDVGGLFGNLFGGGSSIDTSTPAALVAGAAGALNAFSGAGTTTDASGNPVASSNSPGLLSSLGSVGTGVKALDFITGGKLLDGVKSYVFDAVGYTPGSSIGGWVSSLIGEETGGVAAGTTGALGGAASAAGEAGGAAVAAGEAGAAGAESLSAGVGAIGAGVNAISSALPYIGTAISVLTDIAMGNYRGAALIATGAIIGTAILPGIGTAVGAALGGLVDMFLPNHPKNPFQNTEVDIVDGRIVAGKSVSQLENTDAARKEVNDFGTQFGNFLDTVKVQIVGNGDKGKLGDLGSGIKGLAQVDSIDKLFNRLSFQNDPSDTSNFGAAKGALTGMTFNSVTDLSAEILKIARFSDGMDQLGIKLAAVGTDLTNISVASVSLTGALTDQATATDATGGAPDPLRVALAHDLPGQQFANVDALAAEIDKVNTFVNGTIPGLLNPLLTSTSQLQQQISEVDAKYQDAIHQAEKYGLATQDLIDAQTKANSLLLAPGQIALNYQHVGIADRYTAATSGASLGTTLDAFDDQAHQQRDALQKALTDEFGDTIKSTAYYAGELANLEKTLGAERLKTAQQFAQQQAAALLGVGVTVFSVRARQDTLNGDDKAAELIGYDIKAAQERQSFAKTLTDFYGDAYASSAEYQGYMTELETVQQGERLAIVKKYGDQITTATANAMSQARSNVGSLFTSLGDYATKLQTGSASPLSATDQYQVATSKFNAVSGAAAAGDYTSATELQGYADTFLTASRSVNGSGVAYAADFSRVLDALSSVTAATDALTASAFLKGQQDVIDANNAAIADLRDTLNASITALRKEIQFQANKDKAA